MAARAGCLAHPARAEPLGVVRGRVGRLQVEELGVLERVLGGRAERLADPAEGERAPEGGGRLAVGPQRRAVLEAVRVAVRAVGGRVRLEDRGEPKHKGGHEAGERDEARRANLGHVGQEEGALHVADKLANGDDQVEQPEQPEPAARVAVVAMLHHHEQRRDEPHRGGRAPPGEVEGLDPRRRVGVVEVERIGVEDEQRQVLQHEGGRCAGLHDAERRVTAPRPRRAPLGLLKLHEDGVAAVGCRPAEVW